MILHGRLIPRRRCRRSGYKIFAVLLCGPRCCCNSRGCITSGLPFHHKHDHHARCLGSSGDGAGRVSAQLRYRLTAHVAALLNASVRLFSPLYDSVVPGADGVFLHDGSWRSRPQPWGPMPPCWLPSGSSAGVAAWWMRECAGMTDLNQAIQSLDGSRHALAGFFRRRHAARPVFSRLATTPWG